MSWAGNAVFLYAFGAKRYKGVALVLFWVAVVLFDTAVSVACYAVVPFVYLYPVVILLSMAIELGAFCYVADGSTGQRIFFCLCATCSAAVIATLNGSLYGVENLATGVIKLAICFGLAGVYIKYCRVRVEQIFRGLEGHWLWINATGMLFSAVCYYLLVASLKDYLPWDVTVMVTLLTLVAYAGLFCTLTYMSTAVHLAESKLQEELLMKQVERLMDGEEQARIMRHDLRHHNLTIMAFVKKGQHEALLEYLTQYDQSMMEDSHPCYCEHKMVNNILGVYAHRAQDAGVAFLPQVGLEEDCPVRRRDLMSLLSNLLENALHGSEGAKNAEIVLKLFTKDNKLVIICENTAPRLVRFEDGIPQSYGRKGSGLPSILRTVKHHDGMADFWQSGGKFTAHIVLNM